jgi:hypothetical protein
LESVLSRALADGLLQPMDSLLQNDVVYFPPNSPYPVYAFVLYSNIITTSFALLQAALMKAAASSGCAYVLRVVDICSSSPSHQQPLWMQVCSALFTRGDCAVTSSNLLPAIR